ncbi:MAG: hypothetical protein MRJ96_11290 [Nitrospirales bacterium]|nr:hypothetical protein [Nitrospirales bacterium]
MNQFLRKRGVALLEQRIPVLAYGTNPCPGQLAFKFRSIESRVVPVLKGRLKGWDTVYKFLSRSGYAYAQLIPADDVEVEVWVTLLDQIQFEHMNTTEGIFSIPKQYEVGIVSNVQSEHGKIFSALFYAGNTRIFLSPGCDGQKDTPVSILEIPAKGRVTPSLTQEEILNHCVRVFELEGVLKACFPQDDTRMPRLPGLRLAEFLNRHFLAHGGEGATCRSCDAMLSRIFQLTESLHCHALSVSQLPGIQRTLLEDPNKSPMTFGDVWG